MSLVNINIAECTVQYDTKKGGDIYVFVEKQILVHFNNSPVHVNASFNLKAAVMFSW